MEESIKLVIVGDAGVGKTCLLNSYLAHPFPESLPTWLPTVYDGFAKSLVMDGTPFRFVPVDTAPRDGYHHLRPLAYPQTDVFLVCFSLVEPSSFENIRTKWYPEIEHHSPGVPHFLVGTKLDMRDNKEHVESLRQNGMSPIQTSDGEALKNELNSFKYMECCALNQHLVNDVFREAIRCVIASSARFKATKAKCVVL